MVYGFTIFLSALLLFGVQPLAGRQIVPWFGGTAAVWTACMLFFQVVLLLGYSYAHWVATRLSARNQARVHTALLLVSLLTLPIVPSAAWKPLGGEEPTWRVLGALASGVGLPYFVLSTTNPLLTAWYARLNPGVVPYTLFSLSNLGAMMALFAYPLLVEPSFTLRHQAWGWSAFYVLLSVLLAVVAFRAQKAPLLVDSLGEDESPPPGLGRRWLWLALSTTSSVLLLAITNFLSHNVAAIPFLWVLPLALYLFSFILCFSSIPFYQRWFFYPACVLLLYWIGKNLGDEDSHNVPLQQMIPIFCSGFFVFCMVCHGELARSKPSPRFLTEYYLLTSVGGALGGMFVGVVAPQVFPSTWELPMALWAVGALATFLMVRDLPYRWLTLPLAVLALAGQGWLLAVQEINLYRDARLMLRNFYGPLTVDETDGRRRLTHGTIYHGSQFLDEKRKRWNIAYYADESGVGQAILRTRREGSPHKVGVIGLGAGTLAALGRKGDDYTFYEIDPLVVQLAQSEFTYLSDCPAAHRVLLGDARLTLERQEPQKFDVLAVDAFSSDSIPIHLLTLEAFQLYLSHLKPDGVLAVHISNRYLDLEPVLHCAVREYGKEAAWVKNHSDEERAVQRATWVLIGRPGHPVVKFLRDDGWPALDPLPAAFRCWTDDYSNVFGILERE